MFSKCLYRQQNMLVTRPCDECTHWLP